MGKCLVFSLWLARTTSPSNPSSPVTWYQRERHSSAGEAIPCSLAVFCTSPFFSDSVSPLVLAHHFSSSLFPFFFPLFTLRPLVLSPSSTPLSSILPYKHGPIWVCGKGLECMCEGWGWAWDYHHGDQHHNSPRRDGWESVHTFPVLLEQQRVWKRSLMLM